MQNLIRNIIPDNIDELLDRWNREDNEQYRLTLLHRNNDKFYFFLSGNLQEIKPEQKLDTGMSISVSSKKVRINCHYNTTFHKREIKDGYYYITEEESTLEKIARVIPFKFTSEPPSLMVDKNLREKLMDYIIAKSNLIIESLEYIGHNGLIKAIINSKQKKEWKEKSKVVKKIGLSIKEDITKLFEEEQSPSSLISRIEYKSCERNKKVMFEKETRGALKIFLLGIPFIAIGPYSVLNLHIPNESIKYQQKFLQSKEEEARSMLSEFFIANPKVKEGIQRVFEFYKHIANTTIYTGLIGITTLSYAYTWPIISYPMITLAGASGLTMLTNLIRSRGRNSSGIISSLLERRLFDKYE